jgi:hypothetical protein
MLGNYIVSKKKEKDRNGQKQEKPKKLSRNRSGAD